MSIGMQIFLKFLVYFIIIIIVKKIIVKIQTPRKEIVVTEYGERFIHWKMFSYIYMFVGIGFTFIFIIILNLQSNIEEVNRIVVIGIFISFILLSFLLSFLYGRVYVKIGKEKIWWRKMNGEEDKVSYGDITAFNMDSNGNLKLYQNNKCILNFATGEHKIFILEVLKKHKVLEKVHDGDVLLLKEKKGSIIFSLVFFISSAFLFFMSTYYRMFIGMIIFLFCALLFLKAFLVSINNKIIIKENIILEKRFLRKPQKITFDKVKEISFKNRNGVEIICVYSVDKVAIEIPKYYQNIELFEDLINEMGWEYS